MTAIVLRLIAAIGLSLVSIVFAVRGEYAAAAFYMAFACYVDPEVMMKLKGLI
jgi:hypothetical protein